MTTAELKMPTATGRFWVSESGMRDLNASRQPWDLVKELIQKRLGRSSVRYRVPRRH